MSTTLVAPQVAKRPASARSRSLEQPYPLFGFRRQVYWMPRMDRQAEIDAWLFRQARARPREDWPSRWERCHRACASLFKEVWVVRLPRRSRSLAAGDYVFDPLADFLHIPGSPPAVVQDCYQEAFAELPRHRFVYLDLLWDSTPAGLKVVTQARLRDMLSEQEHQFRRRLRNDSLLLEAACKRQRELMSKLTLRRDLLESIRLPDTPAGARRVLGLSTDRLERSLIARLEQIEAARFTKYDPVIVFEEPALLSRAHGYMPLGLIAHWD
jgi:hypothetical protein